MKVVIFGNIPLATKMVKYLNYHSKVLELLVVGQKEYSRSTLHYHNEPPSYQYCKKMRISFLDYDEFLKNDLALTNGFDVGFSGRFNKILPNYILSKFRLGIINMHGGILPEYRGVHGNIHAILNRKQKFGSTLHYMDTGVDTGPIIDIEYFAIGPTDTSYDVFHKTQIAQWSLFKKYIDDILNEKITFDKATPQIELLRAGSCSRTYYQKDILKLKLVNLNDCEELILLKIRAFDFPGHEPAYCYIGNEKIFLRYNK